MKEKKGTITPDHEEINLLLSSINLKSQSEQEKKINKAVDLFLKGDLKTNKIDFYQSGKNLIDICSIEDQVKIIQKMTEKYFYTLDQNQYQNDFDLKARIIILDTIITNYSDQKANSLFAQINEIYNKDIPKNYKSKQAYQYFHLKIGYYKDLL